MMNDSVPGTKRQDPIQRTQHRPEENEQHDDTVQQDGAATRNDDKVTYTPPQAPDARQSAD